MARASETAAKRLPATRAWVLANLETASATKLDLELVASLLYGVVRDFLANRDAATAQVLDRVAERLRSLDTGSLDCADLLNLRISRALLVQSGRSGPDETAAGDQSRLCTGRSGPIDMASELFLHCALHGGGTSISDPTRLAFELARWQRPDGGFGGFDIGSFYFTTHAVFALHSCNLASRSVERGQNYLLRSLPALKRTGFLDGLLEVVLMLDEMGVPIPDRSRYLAYIDSKTRTDGSICFFDAPGCAASGHATGLLLELLRRSAAKASPRPRGFRQSKP